MTRKDLLSPWMILYAAPFIMLGVWLLGAFETSLNYDNTFLLESAKRMLDGERMSEAYFDTNPPWSIIQYLPMAILERAGMFPAPYTVYAYTTLIILIFTAQLLRLLRFYPEISPHQKALLIFCFLIANTTFTAWREFYFGERDQFIFIGLLTLIVYQDLIYKRPAGFTIKPFDIVFMALSTCFILLKPHYLLIPGLMGLYRLHKTRKFWRTIFSPDALTIAGVMAAYILILFIFFQDFIQIILPLVVGIYIQVTVNVFYPYTIIICCLLYAGMFLALLSKVPFHKAKLSWQFFGLSLLCFLLFAIQAKGFFYHLIPMSGFLILALGNLIYTILSQRKMREEKFVPLTMLGFFVLSLGILQPITAPTHQEYKAKALLKALDDCAEECSYYMFSHRLDITQQVGYYGHMKHASRFPTPWMLIYSVDNPKSQTARDLDRWLIEDFKKYQPDYLIINSGLMYKDKPLDFMNYLSDVPEGRDITQQYKIVRSLTLNMNDYLGAFHKQPAPSNYLIYKRKSD